MQGEYYFSQGDYETSLFKWKQVQGNSLGEWAKKNCADAHLLLNQQQEAEALLQDILLTVKDQTLLLETNITNFYHYQKKQDKLKALWSMQRALSINPHYKNIKEQAFTFFNNEALQTPGLIIQLIIDSICSSDTHDSRIIWLNRLSAAINKGQLKGFSPQKLNTLLKYLISIKWEEFDELVTLIEGAYRKTNGYFEWTLVLGQALMKFDMTFWKNRRMWLSNALNYLLEHDQDITKTKNSIRYILTCWYKSIEEDRSVLYNYLKAWENRFEHSFDLKAQPTNKEIHDHLFSKRIIDGFFAWINDSKFNFPEILRFKHAFSANLEQMHLLVAGSFNNGKSSFINTVLKDEILSVDVLPTTSGAIVIQNGYESFIRSYEKNKMNEYSSLSSFKKATTIENEKDGKHSNALFHLKMENEFLEKHKVTLIDSPGFNDKEDKENPVLNYLHLADSLVFVLSTRHPFTRTERDKLLQISEAAPHVPIHFVLNKIDAVDDEEEREDVMEDVKRKINKVFPKAIMIPFSSKENSMEFRKGFEKVLPTLKKDKKFVQTRMNSVIQVFEETIASLKNQSLPQYEQGIVNDLRAIIKKENEVKQVQDEWLDFQNEITLDFQESIKDGINSLTTLMWKDVPQMIEECKKTLMPENSLNNNYEIFNREINQAITVYSNGALKSLIFQSTSSITAETHALLKRIERKSGKLNKDLTRIIGEVITVHIDTASLFSEIHSECLRIQGQSYEESIYLKSQLTEFLNLHLPDLLKDHRNKFHYNRMIKEIDDSATPNILTNLQSQFFSAYHEAEIDFTQELKYTVFDIGDQKITNHLLSLKNQKNSKALELKHFQKEKKDIEEKIKMFEVFREGALLNSKMKK
ncbi:hypothetical protein KR50_35370 [Jeotgalibacillus campisalis]|uniref:Dynamin N-terminal domain-containing protein n=2 Tax=Jeotgalibacillus campisalis TaxID=220754 RepID=A0A0C2RMY6_9BACL|nr:hypothetical protein KR50_35370 [Jeotgalibacillus campisalis]